MKMSNWKIIRNEFDSDLKLILSQRVWQAVSGLVTVIMITRYLNPEFQGWYYSFLSIASLYYFFDLGLSIVLTQLSAHYFVGLRWLPQGGLEGRGILRFHAFTSRAVKLYVLLAIAFIVIILPSGFLFFSIKSGGLILPKHWQWSWMLLIFATASGIMIMPWLSIIEGSGCVAETYAIRLTQGIFGSIASWIILIMGGGLWATFMMPAISSIVAGMWLRLKRPVFLNSALKKFDSDILWRTEVWPLQWRLGLGWISGYLLTQIYTLILFHTQGPVVAGQMGLSLTLANMVGLLSQSWITRRVPGMAQAVARHDWDSLDRLFKPAFFTVTIMYLLGAFGLCMFHNLISHFTHYGERVLPFWSFVGLLAAVFFGVLNSVFAVQLRSFKREPLVWITLAGAVITVPSACWGSIKYSSGGVVIIMFGIQFIFIFPISFIIWRKYNRLWKSAKCVRKC